MVIQLSEEQKELINKAAKEKGEKFLKRRHRSERVAGFFGKVSRGLAHITNIANFGDPYGVIREAWQEGYENVKKEAEAERKLRLLIAELGATGEFMEAIVSHFPEMDRDKLDALLLRLGVPARDIKKWHEQVNTQTTTNHTPDTAPYTETTHNIGTPPVFQES
jgi:hypothetical protein